MRTVANVLMNKPPVFNFIDPDAKVIEALQLMNSVNLSYLVVNKDDTFYGIFSERDYSRNVILKGLHSDSCAVKDVMSTSLPVIALQDTVEHCMELLNTHKTRYLIAFEDNQLKGVVTINDVLREALESKEMVFDELALNQAIEWEDKIY
ncbi:CBS domain-containing protein [Ferruginibacter sp.]|jgi:predicted transcriptional regulator|uniref:CBS domain-containing protein n=1 Tax=Ferruginibacter sp. TaxID=1940288 RepID=UPI0019CC7CE8|nr:CBS domain-containing protein [Ferruginibacter sp.]MBC7626923.1 CBS domain-containing protein [Ferruginibacter sp.]